MIIILSILILILLSVVYVIFLYRNNDNNDNEWYTNNKYLGHALYGIDGNDYTNSMESLEYGYSKGIRVMEVDLLYTKDNHIVANHFWEFDYVLDYNIFMSEKIKNRYSPIDLEILIDYMIKYDDLYFVIDTKEDSYSDNYLNIYKELIDYCKKIDESLLDRIIVQLYSFEMYYDIEEIYSFDNYIFTIYKFTDFNILKISNFCVYNDIDVIAVPEWSIEDGNIKGNYVKFMKNKGLYVYAYTVNDKDVMERYFNMGIDGIYTDFIY